MSLSPRAITASSGPLLSVEGLTCIFGGFKALDEASFKVLAGEFHGLIGPNGAGKSTLFNALTGLVPARGGHVIFNDHPITGLDPHRIARMGIARTFQTVRTFPRRTVADHVCLGAEISPRARGTDAAAALHAVGLSHKASAIPEALSNLERKLLALAICLSMKPRLLLLDEPTAGLDDGETRAFDALLRTVHREWELASVLVEHKLSFVMGLCERITVLDHGRVIAQGTPGEVAHDPIVIDAYLGTSDA